MFDLGALKARGTEAAMCFVMKVKEKVGAYFKVRCPEDQTARESLPVTLTVIGIWSSCDWGFTEILPILTLTDLSLSPVEWKP